MTDALLGMIPHYGAWLLFAVTFLSCLAVPIPSSLLMMTAGGDQRGIHLVADGQQGWLGLAGPNSIAAVEAVRIMIPGSDPEAERSPLLVNLYVGQGEVTWRTAADACAQFIANRPDNRCLQLVRLLILRDRR